MQRFILTLLLSLISISSFGQVYYAKDFGITPNTKVNQSIKINNAIREITAKSKKATLVFEPGRYDFFVLRQLQRRHFISNHDQDNPKNMGVVIESVDGLTLQGNGAEFMFHERMLPISIVNSNNITISGISIDFEKPHIAQAKVIKNDTVKHEITYRVAPWVSFELQNGEFINKGEEWENKIGDLIAFEKKTKRLVYNTSDVHYGKRESEIIDDSTIVAKWDNKQLIPGTILAMRSWHRPNPGIFISHSKNTKIINSTVHYAEGMGLLAQMSENILLDGFNVALRGDSDPRYFTTQADATHFSGCKGKIISRNGLYEGMMDDAINIHGTYLKIIKKLDSKTVVACYMHPQTWGFDWGYEGDKVQFVASKTMEIIGAQNKVATIKPSDQDSVKGAKEFVITFKNELSDQINAETSIGIENLTWTPEVLFENNLIRNNRARGTLFSTPRKTIIQNNTFDHTSGTAILLCGDCNGWFETGACKDVTIRNNVFINALTNMFQFTNAIISIYPEIPDLNGQTTFFHSGIKIYDNKFITFDKPILYAKSVDGLVFRNNIIETNNDYPAFHSIKSTFLFEKTKNIKIKDNSFDFNFDPKTEIIFK